MLTRVGLVLALAGALASAAPQRVGERYLLLHGSLFGASYGPVTDYHVDALSLGVGYGVDFAGLTVSTKLGEVFPSSWGADSARMLCAFPVYTHLTFGLTADRAPWLPIIYGYGGAGLIATGDQRYIRLGAGFKWILWAVSPSVELGWRHVIRGEQVADQVHARVVLDLGGWWAFRLD